VFKEGEVLVFQNVYQHCIGEFSLRDVNKPRYRKILTFFLVDPTKCIMPTVQVPPQDVSWQDKVLKEWRGNVRERSCNGYIDEEVLLVLSASISLELPYESSNSLIPGSPV
jgi:Protein of unknown function (DUF4246)